MLKEHASIFGTPQSRRRWPPLPTTLQLLFQRPSGCHTPVLISKLDFEDYSFSLLSFFHPRLRKILSRAVNVTSPCLLDRLVSRCAAVDARRHALTERGIIFPPAPSLFEVSSPFPLRQRSQEPLQKREYPVFILVYFCVPVLHSFSCSGVV